jgi:hypothetical protein
LWEVQPHSLGLLP